MAVIVNHGRLARRLIAKKRSLIEKLSAFSEDLPVEANRTSPRTQLSV
jgi:hypothetical protein